MTPASAVASDPELPQDMLPVPAAIPPTRELACDAHQVPDDGEKFRNQPGAPAQQDDWEMKWMIALPYYRNSLAALFIIQHSLYVPNYPLLRQEGEFLL